MTPFALGYLDFSTNSEPDFFLSRNVEDYETTLGIGENDYTGTECGVHQEVDNYQVYNDVESLETVPWIGRLLDPSVRSTVCRSVRLRNESGYPSVGHQYGLPT